MSQSIYDDYDLSPPLAAEIEKRRRAQLEAERRRREEEEQRRREDEEQRRREQDVRDEKARGSWASRLEEVARVAREAAAEDNRRRSSRASAAQDDPVALARSLIELRQALCLAPAALSSDEEGILDRARCIVEATDEGGMRDAPRHRQLVEAALAELAELPRRVRRRRDAERRDRQRLVAQAARLLGRLTVIETQSPLAAHGDAARALRGRVEGVLADGPGASAAASGLARATAEVTALESAFEEAHREGVRRETVLRQVVTALDRLGYEARPLLPAEEACDADVVRLLHGPASDMAVRATFGLDGSVRLEALHEEGAAAAGPDSPRRLDAVRRWCQAYERTRGELEELGFVIRGRELEPGQDRGTSAGGHRRPQTGPDELRLLEGHTPRQRRQR